MSFITNIYTIQDHPISKVPIKYQKIYIAALGGVLFRFSNGDNNVKVFYEAWAESITGVAPNSDWYSTTHPKIIKRALGIHRIGFRFFSMKRELFFDIYYLLSLLNSLPSDLYEQLRKEYCGLFTKDALETTDKYFRSGVEHKNIPGSLIRHREINLNFAHKPLSRILVVANIGAGKSTLINALIGRQINRTQTNACTDKLCYIYNKPTDDGITYIAKDGNLHYDIDVNSLTSNDFMATGLAFRSTLSDEHICIIDTPGLNNAAVPQMRQITIDAIRDNQYDMLIYVANCRYFSTTDERDALDIIAKYSKQSKIFVLNKLDSFKQRDDSVEKMLSDYHYDLKRAEIKGEAILPLSAIAAVAMRQDRTTLDEWDLDDLEQYDKIFSKEYYHLPKYVVGSTEQSDTLSKTGILLLEKTIKNLL